MGGSEGGWEASGGSFGSGAEVRDETGGKKWEWWDGRSMTEERFMEAELSELSELSGLSGGSGWGDQRPIAVAEGCGRSCERRDGEVRSREGGN